MRPIIFGWVILHCAILICGTVDRTPPKWPSKYHLEGVINLPYAEIKEPFSAWFDGDSQKSRVDYYYGAMETVQRPRTGEYGSMYVVSPHTDEYVRNVLVCNYLNGTQDEVVGPQHTLPDMTNFTYAGDTVYRGKIDVHVWQYIFIRGDLKNTYTVYVSTDGSNTPLYYETVGYNVMFQSHRDEYVIEYNSFSTDFPSSVFDQPMEGLDCSEIGPPTDKLATRIFSNPISEFIHPVYERHLAPMYRSFVKRFNKEHQESRMHTFKHNIRYINSINRNNLSFKLKINHFADMRNDEMRKLKGRKTTTPEKRRQTESKVFQETLKSEELPSQIDWRLYGAVTPVKDQALCGSCWAFGSTGAIEGAYFLKTGRQVLLSQQCLIDCSWGFGNDGCQGGEEFASYEYVIENGGLATEEEYGKYMGVNAYCGDREVKKFVQLDSYVNVTSGNMAALKMAIYQHGPVAVGIDASLLSFVFYSHGVYYDPKCGKDFADLDHSVLAVGYGEILGHTYTLIKNSWSTHWGNDGYVLISQKDNVCGVATDPTFVNIK